MHSEPKISSSEKNSFLKRVRGYFTGVMKWIVKKRDWVKFFTYIAFGILFFLGIVLYKTIYHDTAFQSEICLPSILGNLAIINDNKCDIGVAIERLGFAIGGIIALLVALASFQRARALDDTAKAQEQGNIEDRYNNAITQFGNANSSIRLAGAYSLYHLAIDNKERRKNICDVLCVHIRNLTTSKDSIFNRKSYSSTYKNNSSNEVQSILDILTNKDNEEYFPFKSHWINLSNAYLNGAILIEAQLQGADLSGTQLQGAFLNYAQLQEANLVLAQLQGASLWGAQLQGTYLREAELQGAHLNQAKIQGADFKRAQLQGANLSIAELQSSNLGGAELQGADLTIASLQGADLAAAEFQGADLGGAELQGADLRNAQLQGADLGGAKLQGACLERAELQGANLRSAQLQGADLTAAQIQGAILEETNFRGAFTKKNNKKYFNINAAIKQLKDRINKKDTIENMIFSGGVIKGQLELLKKVKTNTIKELAKIKAKYYSQHKISHFQRKITDVKRILEENKNKKANYKFPSKYVKTIKKGVYPKAKAKQIIRMLRKVKKIRRSF